MIQVNDKTKILIFLICIVALVSTVNSTYARYVSAANGTVTTDLARWQLFVNSENITSNYESSMTFTPVILPNENVAANKIAPSSKGYFDIAINPENVDVSFIYDISVNIPEDSLITDIKVTDYAVVEGLEITAEDNTLTKTALTTSNLTNTLLYDNNVENFIFKPFVVRMYFSWVDDETGTMSDADDANVGNMITNGEDTKFVLGLNVSFKQYIGEPENNNNPQPDNTGGSENGEQEPSGGETPVEPETPVDPEDPDNPDNPDNTEDPEQQEPES